MWDDFSLRMARIGAQIIRYRAYYCKKLLAHAAAVYADIAPQEVLSGEYRTVSTVTDPFADAKQIEKQLIEHVYSHKKAEIAAKSCLSGPHKDDLELLLDGRSAASFGSQGQVRTCTLSLKLAERELFFSEDGEYPVLLLDDVLSELDRRRQDFVLNRISAGQVMITCCEDGISEKLRAGAVFAIKNGKNYLTFASFRYTNTGKNGIIKSGEWKVESGESGRARKASFFCGAAARLSFSIINFPFSIASSGGIWMYLHLGQDYIVPLQSVVAVFDMDTATVSKRTQRLLTRLQEEGRIIELYEDLPRAGGFMRKRAG